MSDSDEPVDALSCFAHQVATVPQGLAVVGDGVRLTYAELDARADAVARRLVGAGVWPGESAVVLPRRTTDIAAMLLGILKSGAAYVLLDPETPADLLEAALALVAPSHIVAGSDADGRQTGVPPHGVPVVTVPTGPLAEHRPFEARFAAHPERTACVLVAPEAPGGPCAVDIPHRALSTLTEDPPPGGGPRSVLLHAPPWSPAHLVELWLPLLSGGTLVLAAPNGPQKAGADGAGPALAEPVRKWRATTALLSGGALTELADSAPAAFDTLHEAVLPWDESVLRPLPGQVAVRQVYGSPEGGVWSVRRDGTDGPGRPLRGQRVYVLDRSLGLAPVGATGDLYIAGSGLAAGFRGTVTATARRFVADPFGPPGSRMVCTGDRACWTATGGLEIIRRHAGSVSRESDAAGTACEDCVLDPARTPTEEILCGLFAEVLGLARVGADDDFYDLGGHSLLATRLVSRIRNSFARKLSVGDFFSDPTPAGTARALRDAVDDRPAAGPMERPEAVPLSYAQQRMWFLQQLNPETAEFNVPLVLRLRGELDRRALASALRDLVARHESLRTVFPDTGGEPRQVVLDPHAVHVLLPGLDTDGAGLAAQVPADVCLPFDLATEPPLRARLFRLAPDEHVLLLVIHHIACDGWSWEPIRHDLSAAYAARRVGRTPHEATAAVQYIDFTLWQRALLGAPDAPDSRQSTQLAHWRAALAGLPDELPLPADRPRPTNGGGRVGGTVTFRIDAGLHRALAAVARECRATFFMVVHAALASLLTRLGSGSDIPVGTAVAGRTDEAFDDAVGFFVNTLVLRVDTSGSPTFRELVDRVRRVDLDAYDHQDVPFDRVVEELRPARPAARHPLFQVMLVLQNNTVGGFRLPGLTTEVLNDDPDRRAELGLSRAQERQNSPVDLLFILTETATGDGAPAGVTVVVDYAADLFDTSTVCALADALIQELRALAADPGAPAGAAAGGRTDPGLVARVHARRDSSADPTPAAADAPATAGSAHTPDEEILCGLFAEVLGVAEAAPDDDFFALGGHSLLATRLVSRIRSTLRGDLTLRELFEAPTPRALTARFAVDRRSGGTLLPVRATGAQPPLFCLHPGSGLGWPYANLARHLPDSVPLHAVQARGLHGPGEELPGTLTEMAEDYLCQLRTVQPHGPYRLLGWSFGGNTAHVMATLLQERGECVELLALLDSLPLGGLASGAGDERDTRTDAAEADAVMRAESDSWEHFDEGVREAVTRVFINNYRLMTTARHSVYRGDVLYLAATGSPTPHVGAGAWKPYVDGRLESHAIPGAHSELLRPGPAAEIGRILSTRLER